MMLAVIDRGSIVPKHRLGQPQAADVRQLITRASRMWSSQEKGGCEELAQPTMGERLPPQWWQLSTDGFRGSARWSRLFGFQHKAHFWRFSSESTI
jgi:hypothetical protein